MSDGEITELTGVVTRALPNALFRVKLEDGREILAHLSGQMRRFHIRVMPGDEIKLEMTKYDQTKGRITYRFK